jgi:hypothetical protein
LPPVELPFLVEVLPPDELLLFRELVLFELFLFDEPFEFDEPVPLGVPPACELLPLLCDPLLGWVPPLAPPVCAFPPVGAFAEGPFGAPAPPELVAANACPPPSAASARTPSSSARSAETAVARTRLDRLSAPALLKAVSLRRKRPRP